jgi:hypothetical protein
MREINPASVRGAVKTCRHIRIILPLFPKRPPRYPVSPRNRRHSFAMGMPRSPSRARRRAETHNHRPVGASSGVRRVAGELRVGISRGSVGWIRIHRVALAGFTGASEGIARRCACPRSVLAGDRTVFAEAGGSVFGSYKSGLFYS